jgi:acyl-CoA synthetase (NDP forming)
LTADLLGQSDLELPPLTDHARDGINEVLQGFGWAANPADVTSYASRDTIAPIMELMIEEPEVEALVVASSASQGQASHIVNVKDNHNKLVAFLYTGNELEEPTGLQTLRAAQVPVFNSPENLAFALKQWQWYHQWRKMWLKSIHGASRASLDYVNKTRGALSFPDRALSEHQSKELLQQWSIPTTSEWPATTVDEALNAALKTGYPVALKVDSPDILHKTEVGGIKLGIRTAEELRDAYHQVLEKARAHAPAARINGVLVQEMVEPVAEMIVGITQDSQLGPVVLFGIGGTLVEVMKDVALRICPITPLDADQMIQEVRGRVLLHGYRGRPPADVAALKDVLLKVSALAIDLGDRLKEMDINPLAVLEEGKGVKALDAAIILQSSPTGSGR